MYVKGILDAESTTDFDLRLSYLREKWNALIKNEAATMKKSMIASVQESAGLGSPPVKYSTNRNECMNNVPISHTDYHKCSWVELTTVALKVALCDYHRWTTPM